MIKVKKHILGRPIAKPTFIILPQSINVGYGSFKLRPKGSRDIRAECRQLTLVIMKINGMSG
jgi:hypothetical protein